MEVGIGVGYVVYGYWWIGGERVYEVRRYVGVYVCM